MEARSASERGLRGLVRCSQGHSQPGAAPAAAGARQRERRRGSAGAARDLALLVAGVAVEGAGGGELAELVADHVLGHEHGDELAPVVDGEGEPDGVRA